MKDSILDPDAPESLNDFFFDPDCRPTTTAGKKAVLNLKAWFLDTEPKYTPRKRNRKQRDLETLELQLGAILGNLTTAHFRKKPRPVAISHSKNTLGSKDTHRVYGDTLPRLIYILEQEQLLNKSSGSHEERRLTTIEATSKLHCLLAVQPKDFQYKERAPIVLRDRKTSEDKKRGCPGKYLPVPDSDEARRMTNEVHQFNAFLARQQIRYIGPRTDVDDERRTTHRVFNNGSLTDGGRLYGGFWQSLSGDKDGKPDERLDIVINGENLVGLDYGQIAIRILYSLVGCQPAMNDCYVLDGWGVESREGMKKLINTMINDPGGSANATKKLFGKKGIDYKNVRALTDAAKQAILEQHAPIAEHFNGKSTYRLLYEESNLLMCLLMELVDKDIPALPIHDCLYVRGSDVNTVKELMKVRFRERFNVWINIK